jgi:hypothetical protein
MKSVAIKKQNVNHFFIQRKLYHETIYFFYINHRSLLFDAAIHIT